MDGCCPSTMGKLRVLSCAGSEIAKESAVDIHLSQTGHVANALEPPGHKSRNGETNSELSNLWMLPCLGVYHL